MAKEITKTKSDAKTGAAKPAAAGAKASAKSKSAPPKAPASKAAATKSVPKAEPSRSEDRVPAPTPSRGGASTGEPRGHEDAGLTAPQIKVLYEALVQAKDRAERGLNRHLSEAVNDIESLADEADLASRNAEQAWLIRFADKERKLLNEINHAIAKMHAGTYGLCEGTEEPIGFARLEARPWTRYSIEHKEQLERLKGERAG